MTPVRAFARVDTGGVPDESTICRFRHWLERYERTPTFLVGVRNHLKAHGLIVKTGAERKKRFTVTKRTLVRNARPKRRQKGRDGQYLASGHPTAR